MVFRYVNVRMNNMKRLFIMLIVAAMFVLSCGDDGQDANIASDLESIFSTIPSQSASDSILWFSNMERIKELAGVSPDTSLNEYINKTTEREVYQLRMDLLSGYTLSPFSGEKYMASWSDTFGFDSFDTNQEIWISQVELKGIRPLFSVMKGNFDKNKIIEKLNNLGYQLKEYTSIDYFSINEDYRFGGPDASKAVLLAKSFLNRIMVEEREIIAAPADEILFSVLDVRAGKDKSLKESIAHTRVAEALGDVLGAALIPQSQLFSENVNTKWGRLHTYDLAGIGYIYGEEEQKVVIVLHYTDKSAANDIDELNRRMAEYVVTIGNLETPLLSDLFDIGEPEVTVYGPDSILKVELIYKPDTPRTLWSAMVEMQDLGFLVVDPSEQMVK
jgi:hypothetical protein